MLEKLNPPQMNKRYRFRILKGQKLNDGSIDKQHQVGVALLSEGQSIYTIHLYVFQNNPFFLVGHKQDLEFPRKNGHRIYAAKDSSNWTGVINPIEE